MSLRNEIQNLARQFDLEDEEARSLWSWLPSFKAAEKAHGDYAWEVQPSMDWILAESRMVFAVISGLVELNQYNCDIFRCPCNDCEDKIPTVKEVEKTLQLTFRRDEIIPSR